MSRNSRFSKMYLPFVCVVLVLFSNCKKIPFDYRNKYVGTWDFHYISRAWSAGGGQFQSTSDTGDFKGKIYYSLTEFKREYIIVEFSTNEKVSIKVDKNGNFSECTNGCINGKNISFNYSSSECGGGLGAGNNYKVTGTKD
jgi:hypothetical protein